MGRASLAEQGVCAKAGRLGRTRQVGKTASNCVSEASTSGGLGSGKEGGREGGGLTWRGFCALQRSCLGVNI